MRGGLSVFCLMVAACARSTPVQRTTSLPVPAKTTDEATILAMTHSLLDAYDRADDVSFGQAVGSRFVQVDEERIVERHTVLTDLQARRARQAPQIHRTYLEERGWVATNSAVYVGEAIEHWPLEGKRPTDFDGWSTVVWAREGDEWKVVSWQWVRGGLDGARRNWNATFREERGLPHLPSAFLTRMVHGRTPGRALDVATGQGRNALYLASQGWQVTGIDISDEGLRQAREAADAWRLRLDLVNADMNTWDYGVERWDLVALIYAGPICEAKRLVSVQRGLVRGGLVVVEGFHKDSAPEIGCSTGELSAAFKTGFVILHDEVVNEKSEWGNGNGLPERVVQFAAQKL